MPSAAPVPRSPSVLTLATSDELLTRPGCPVCRYAAEASDRYLAWFAVEAHADPVTITRLCESLGMCPRHTRALIRQPGAATRLTAVYRYLLQAAQGKLAGRVTKLAGCPACEHDNAAAGRALETLLEGLSEVAAQKRYLELGGMCGPHVRAATGVRSHRRAAAWVVRAMADTTGHPASLETLAGGPDHDAGERARLRAALPSPGLTPPVSCPVCLATAQAEFRELAQAARAGGHFHGADGIAPPPDLCLCAAHLHDAVLIAATQAQAVLAWQADCLAAELARWTSPGGRRRSRIPPGWLPGRSASRRGAAQCPVCRAMAEAARQELQRCRSTLRAEPPGSRGQLLCVRHVLTLRAADPAAGRTAADLAARQAGTLLCELGEAFRKSTWAHRHETRGPEATAWQRALVFLDGGVSGGCLPMER